MSDSFFYKLPQWFHRCFGVAMLATVRFSSGVVAGDKVLLFGNVGLLNNGNRLILVRRFHHNELWLLQELHANVRTPV